VNRDRSLTDSASAEHPGAAKWTCAGGGFRLLPIGTLLDYGVTDADLAQRRRSKKSEVRLRFVPFA
jgi:hypothetical protein